MLEEKEKTNPEGWATHFCEPMSKARPRPMTNDETKMLIQLHMAGDDFVMPPGEKPFAFEMLDKRLSLYGFKMTDAAKLFVAGISSTPGEITMHLSYIAWHMSKSNVKVADVEFLCTKVWPMGMIKEEDLRALWAGQKICGANLLDCFAAGESIISKMKADV
jgi:hypothetical protein